ncbi:DUF2306 domain-containing protein [Seohaeicola saemankumensis]|nr:DUF2306 domain-containing protein [Seohaeicola saemankumensis]MCA0871614.1 DUF2306 domain-containing protein [Seohaeicola saemankumensis]
MSREKVPFLVIAISSLVVALVSFRFIPLGIENAFPVLLANADANRGVFMAHVIAASVALAVAVPQFLPDMRTRRPGLHRMTGRIYVAAILIGGLSGGALAIAAAPDRPVAGAGFGLLALAWLGVTGVALYLARTRQIARHRVWMIRSFALTFAAVTLRLQLPLFFAAGLEYPEASNWVAWTCWVPNLIVAEWILRRAPGSGRAVGVA